MHRRTIGSRVASVATSALLTMAILPFGGGIVAAADETPAPQATVQMTVDRFDPAPGADRSVPSVSELAVRLGPESRTNGVEALTSRTPGIACDGNGTDGNRVQAVYAYLGTKDRSKSVTPLIRRYAAQVDKVFRSSAERLGGSRRVRWATTSGCVLTVLKVKLSRTARDDFWAFTRQMAAKGLTRTDRQYLVWFDTGISSGACGMGQSTDDASKGPANRSNVGPKYAWAVAPCWGTSATSGTGGHESTEAHELMHMLGSVNPGAPHATPSGHCYDEWDLMCYRDGDQRMHKVCSSALKNAFDCKGDDYFNPKPRAGSWLARHWNTAFSSFLIGSDTGAPKVSQPVAESGGSWAHAQVGWDIKEDQRINRVAVERRVDAGEWTGVTDHSNTWLQVYDLSRGHSYTWRIRAMDSAGRWSAWASSNVLAVPLNALPIVAMDAPQRTSWDPDSSAWTIGFSWAADDADGWVDQIDAQLSTNGGATFASIADDDGLEVAGTAGHAYVVRARAADDQGAWGTWATSSTMTVSADMAPALFAVSVWVDDWDMTATVEWSADDETGVTASEVSVATDGGVSMAIPGTNFHVVPDHTYVVTVRVRDAAGHWSATTSTEYST